MQQVELTGFAMRIGDFAVEVVARGKGVGVREIGSGHVLARPGQVYALRLRNFGPLRCVAEVTVDGRTVTAGGLVIEPWCTEELERPITPDEDGRFTVVAEGDERVFAPDGGRDNPDLGLIEVRFGRELPGGREAPRPLPPSLTDELSRRLNRPTPSHPSPLFPKVPEPFTASASGGPRMPSGSGGNRLRELLSAPPQRWPMERSVEFGPHEPTVDEAERAAGTGLTGHSAQRFTATQVGPLEKDATVVQLRLVIASVETISGEHAPVESPAAPVRPVARP